jgi:Mannosylglycerate hydrolase MGH1-like glycoside hydrolase domain
MPTAEHARLSEIKDDITGWRRWGPYVSDRAWGTVREDYSADGNAWAYLTHDQSRSKAYRWGEDGIAGLCDRFQLLLFAPAFWNGRDPLLKERLFGLTPGEANHGEDVKECYFYLDNLPSHSYMKFLYKYPQTEYPYGRLIEVNKHRNRSEPEFELIDTGVFDEERYFDIFIEYGKVSPEDIVVRVEAINRGPEPAPLDILPHLWFRNTWAWHVQSEPEPVIRSGPTAADYVSLCSDDSAMQALGTVPVFYRLGRRILYAPPGGRLLFTNNETNMPRVYGPGHVSRSPFVKDAFHDAVIKGAAATNPAGVGTKAAIHYRFDAVPPGGSVILRLRLTEGDHQIAPLALVEDCLAQRRREADEYYAALHPAGATVEERRVQRQALAGLLWTKQSYLFDVSAWLDGDSAAWQPPPSHKEIRNTHWRHLNSMRVMTMPDKWEYPWFAAWDLAFQCVVTAVIDPDYAKHQLWLLLFEQFQHPNGQIPAYEWEFSELNPPVHAWAVWRVYNMDRIRSGKADRAFLEKCFHKLLMSFAWWINKVDRQGNNVFEGGFLGLDNIAVADRSQQSGDGGVLEQSDATGWMGMMCQNLMRIALELAKENRVYESMASKFFQHYTYVAHAMKHMGNRSYQLWDDRDGFFYDVMTYPDGRFRKFRVRSLVGLVPLFAVERLELKWIEPFRDFRANVDWFLKNRPDLVEDVVHTVENDSGLTHVLTVVDQKQLARIMDRVWDENEFLSPYGIRSLSRAHLQQPFEMDGMRVGYEPAEALTAMKGGNSNWRGPVWLPANFLLIESLRKLGTAFGHQLTLTPPAAGGRPLTFQDMARELANRLIRLFMPNEAGDRPIYGGDARWKSDPQWREYLWFHEYFHGDNGKGLGACHQTGWTALIASLIDEWRR